MDLDHFSKAESFVSTREHMIGHREIYFNESRLWRKINNCYQQPKIISYKQY